MKVPKESDCYCCCLRSGRTPHEANSLRAGAQTGQHCSVAERYSDLPLGSANRNLSRLRLVTKEAQFNYSTK